MEIDLRCESVETMIARLPDGCASFIHSDPPWRYNNSGPPTNHGKGGPNIRGHAALFYAGLTEQAIAGHLAATYRVATVDAYLAVWCTFPKLQEWLRVDAGKWEYISGAAWGKTSNGIGVGFHFRGDSELLLLYKKGTPRPLAGSKSNLWLAHRVGHSEKPQTALRALVSMAAPPGGLVVDCYAGASASLARACRALGRAYAGAELSEARWNKAMIRLSQQEMFSDGSAA